LQRKRAFADYQDLEVQYGRRPSLWIEPIGDWGRGDVELVEIPTPNEMNDNIVAFWRPKDNLKARGEYTFNYRMHWAWDRPWGSRLARIVDTRVGVTADRKGRLFVLDITGEAVKALPPDSRLHADVGTSRGVLRNVVVQPNQDIGGWRVTFELIPADTQVADMHCVLLDEHGPLSETWIYRWTP
jgi:glucans biosynthesis protein